MTDGIGPCSWPDLVCLVPSLRMHHGWIVFKLKSIDSSHRVHPPQASKGQGVRSLKKRIALAEVVSGQSWMDGIGARQTQFGKVPWRL